MGQDTEARLWLTCQAIIRSRILKGQFKVDDSLSPEAKDLVSAPTTCLNRATAYEPEHHHLP
jgi:hypothetical protein